MENAIVSRSLKCFFEPESVAVIGASRNVDSMSGKLYENVRSSFAGPVYAVNPRTAEIQGTRSYPSVAELPGPVQLAFVAVPAAHVLDAVRQCGEHGVEGLVVITAGFSEMGGEGRRREEALMEIVHAYGMRMLGPNCFGLSNTDPRHRLWGTFGYLKPPEGRLAVAAQSGAVGYVVPEYCRRWGLGMSSFVSIGNKADVAENDLLEYWGEDERTDVIVLYVESFVDPRKFLRIAREVTRRKPVVVLKAGRTVSGTRAAASHTAALAGSTEAAEALLEQTGIVRARTFQDLFDTAALLATQPLPAGRRVGILTNAGGPAVLTADALEASGMSLPRFSDRFQQELRSGLPAEAAVANPVDLIGSVDPGQFRVCLEQLLESDELDAVVAIFVPRTEGSLPPIRRAMEEAAGTVSRTKPLVSLVMPAPQLSELDGGACLVPMFPFPESVAHALAGAADYAQRRASPPEEPYRPASDTVGCLRGIAEECLGRRAGRGGWLAPDEVFLLLESIGLPAPAWRMASSIEDAVKASRELPGALALKIVSSSIVHKSDVGGVELDLRGEHAVREAAERLLGRATDDPELRLLVQRYQPEGIDTMLGLVRDPQFGHLVTFGWGGTLVELHQDTTVRLAPLTRRDTVEMIRPTRVAKLLEGFRGAPAADRAALEDALLRVGALAEALPGIGEMDINPLKVLPAGQGVRVLDARIRLEA